MESVRLKNYRCFRDDQTARLAPLTLLVGDNSTGKTSFLAMVRALGELAWRFKVPDFKEEPFDLGSFDEIAHHRGRRGGRADTFEAGFETTALSRNDTSSSDGADCPIVFSFAFEKNGTVPAPARRRLSHGDAWLEERLKQGVLQELRMGTSRGSWKVGIDHELPFLAPSPNILWPPYLPSSSRFSGRLGQGDQPWFEPLGSSPGVTKQDLEEAEQILGHAHSVHRTRTLYASAPFRARPRRTYDPARASPDPEGDHVPMYLANMFFQDKLQWNSLKHALEDFGRSSGLFDEIGIRQLGKHESEPFQLQVRKYGGRLKGPSRNVIDVGYGVSQVLPVITELLRRDAPLMFLLQQPEVHLHPSAQAALGSLFCKIAGPERQLIVETHSDHMLDRICMDIRDGRGSLAPDDVSILFFERSELDVQIHSLELDKTGNVCGAPLGYRRFFMEETRRSLGL